MEINRWPIKNIAHIPYKFTCAMLVSGPIHWNQKIIILTTISSLAASEVVRMKTLGAASEDDNMLFSVFRKLTLHPSQSFKRTRPKCNTWWCHQMETFSALLVFCEGNSPVTGGFPSQRPVTQSFGVFFDLRLNIRLRKQLRRRWFELISRSLWRHDNEGNTTRVWQILKAISAHHHAFHAFSS